MIWKRARLLRERTVSDELNDCVGSGEFETLRKVEARIAPWTVEEQQIYGATVTESEVKVLLKMPRKMYPKSATHIRIEADTSDALVVSQPMEILSVAQRGTRFVTIRCRGWKT